MVGVENCRENCMDYVRLKGAPLEGLTCLSPGVLGNLDSMRSKKEDWWAQ